MKTLVFGSLNIDYVYQMDHIVRPGETEGSTGLEKHAGGKGLNQAIALARAGANTFFAGCIGSDGLFLRELLEENGINTDSLRQKDIPNGNAIIQVDAEGQNAILLFGGSNRAVTEDQIDETLGRFQPGDLLLMQNEINCGGSLLKKAHAAGMKVAVNPSPITKDLLEWPLILSDYLLLNETEGEALTGTSDIQEMIGCFRKRYPNTNVVLTLGEKGAYSITAGQVDFQPAFRVKVIDTTAAGDTFTGYYLQNICSGHSKSEALLTATKASAIAIGIQGAANSIPVRSKVDSKEY